jgi:hypothetical protein
MSGPPACFRHPDTPAFTNCSQCGRPICHACRMEIEGEAYCAEDAQRRFGVRASNVGQPPMPPDPSIDPALEEETITLATPYRTPVYAGVTPLAVIFYFAGALFVQIGLTSLAQLHYFLTLDSSFQITPAQLVLFDLFCVLFIGLGVLLLIVGWAAAARLPSAWLLACVTTVAAIVVAVASLVIFSAVVLGIVLFMPLIGLGGLYLQRRSDKQIVRALPRRAA